MPAELKESASKPSQVASKSSQEDKGDAFK